MTQVMEKIEISSKNLRKCGEISASWVENENKNEFYLNCDFCKCTYLQLNNFIQHIYDDHLAELPGRILKHETPCTQLISPPSPDYNAVLNAAEDDVEDELEMAETLKELQDASNSFETVLMDIEEVDIKEEIEENFMIEKSVHTGQKEIYDANDITNDDDGMASDSEIPPQKKKARRKNTQNNNHVEANTTKGTKKVVDRSQSNAKPLAKYIKITDSVIDDSQRIILAEIYKNYACLWDQKNIEYRLNNRRKKALASACKEFNTKTELNLAENDFAREIICLRKICSNEKKKKVACKKIGIEHKPSCTYYKYIEFLEVDVPPFECSICGDKCRGLGQLKVHEAAHNGTKPFNCHICGRGFQIGDYLTQHLRRHAQDLRYQCEVCEKAFASSTQLVLHRRTHTGEKPFVCYVCGSKFVSASALTEHMLRHEKIRRFKCEVCDKAFYSPSELRGHKTTHKKVPDHICKICGKGFKRRTHLMQHNLIHESVKRYICKICGKRFAQYAGLSGHMKSHGTTLIQTTDNTLK